MPCEITVPFMDSTLCLGHDAATVQIMKVCRIHIRGYRQFQDTRLDFIDPTTDRPADKICFIGRNGTGKSTILHILRQVLSALGGGPHDGTAVFHHPDAIVELESHGVRYYLLVRRGGLTECLDASIDQESDWRDGFFAGRLRSGLLQDHSTREKFQELRLNEPRTDVVVYAPAETLRNHSMEIRGVPTTNVGSALELDRQFPIGHVISRETVADMWRLLLYRVLKREEERREFEARDENFDKTKRALVEEFDAAHPEVLGQLAVIWNRILAPAGLEFDVEHAKIPYQLNDNLEAYIRLKASGERLPYDRLSTGIRDFLFRIGHIFLLFFNRRIERGFVLIDEPENSLFPDFLFELMAVYDQIVRNEDGSVGTQIFMATHNPIVAAQFEPHERIILEWDEHACVTAKKGTAPVGDDPNDVLEQDFQLTHLMGEKGQEMWEEYLDLRKRARRSSDFEEQKQLVERANDIAESYGFGFDEP